MDFKNWNEVIKGNIDTIPDNYRPIEMSDGDLIDTGFHLGSNWYLNNKRLTMRTIKYWRYI